MFMRFPRQSEISPRGGFTLIEVLLGMAILSMLVVLLLSATNQASSTVKRATNAIEAFAAARAAQDLISQRLSQATLNTYWDYYDSSGNQQSTNTNTFLPAAFGRASDLQFVVNQNTDIPATAGQEIYFHTPEAFSGTTNYQSIQGLLNSCGYFVRYGSDTTFRPTLLNTPLRWRYRLMQSIEPTEFFSVYTNSALLGTNQTWTTNLSSNTNYMHPIADNIIAMIVWPRLSPNEDPAGTNLTLNYTYDSKNYTGTSYTNSWANQLPPIVQITFIAIDEPSAVRMDTLSSTPPAIITTALNGKFTNVTNYQADIDSVMATLASNAINARVLNASVVLRESKWSGR